MGKLKLKVPNFPGKDILVRKASCLALRASKHSPEILMVSGIVGGVVATVMACKATLELDEVLAKHEETMMKIEEVLEDDAQYPEYDQNKASRDKVVTTIKTGANLLKLYAPAIAVATVSISAIVGGHCILNKRYLGVTAAYTALQEAYKGYRKRVREEVGEEREKELYLDVYDKVIETLEDDGSRIQETKKLADPRRSHSIYARVFDESNKWFKKNAAMNRMFLQAQQAHANDLLNIRGYLFLNEVYEMLGFDPQPFGQLVGWIKGHGDSFVDFDIFNLEDEAKVAFINGYERSIWLDFNVDGVVYNLL